MAAIGTNANGQPIFVGDQCTVTGFVASISGSGSTANVTVTTDKADSIVVKPGDLSAETGGGPNSNLDSAATNPCQSGDGGTRFGANNRVSISGTVNGAVSGAGSTALVSVKLSLSGGLVTVTAASMRSVPGQAGQNV